MPKWTPEEAREAAARGGKASVEARRKKAEAKERRKSLTPQERAKEAINERLEDLVDELLDAALGEGDFAPQVVTREVEQKGRPTTLKLVLEGLEAKDRLAALKTALVYGLGRPPSATVGRPPEPKDEDTPGLVINTTEEA